MTARIEVDKNVVLVLFNAPERVTKMKSDMSPVRRNDIEIILVK